MKAGFISDSEPAERKMQTINESEIVSALALLSNVLVDGELFIIK